MAKIGKSLDGVLADGEQIVRAWEANPTFALGDVTLASFKAMVEELRDSRVQTEELRTELTRKVNEQGSKAEAVANTVSRARSGFRAVYGPDSSEYEQAGGIRASERKRTARKAKTS